MEELRVMGDTVAEKKDLVSKGDWSLTARRRRHAETDGKGSNFGNI